ncbi:MAG TPA: hypothetical protein VD838_10950, partial [Anaeromyxobacteraceae bacterium]|nr:hypothetical protein [Anaeromyxobacteraceae bacterium]
NGDSGMVLFNNSRVRLVGNTVTGNAAATTRSTALRLSGGVVLRGNPPPPAAAGEPPSLVFHGNVVSGNRGDQVLVYSASGSWILDGGDCGALRNVIGCYDTSGLLSQAFGVAAVDAEALVRRASWQSAIPTSPPDFAEFNGGNVDAGSDGTVELFCSAAPACAAP